MFGPRHQDPDEGFHGISAKPKIATGFSPEEAISPGKLLLDDWPSRASLPFVNRSPILAHVHLPYAVRFVCRT
jgi:hypothetical protein